MIEILKRIERKTLIILICIILLPIIFLVFLALIQGCGSKVNHDTYLQKMESAALKYIKDYDLTPSSEGSEVTVSLEELVDGKYIKSTKKQLKDASCTGEVTIRLNGSQFKSNNGGLLNPIAHLNCVDYESITLKDKIMSDITSSNSGVYAYNGGYIYKGDSVNNYLSLMGNLYLIIGIDSNGFVKLINTKKENEYIEWDNKYNIEALNSYGINSYIDSTVLKKLNSIYESINTKYLEDKKKLVSHNVCVGLRSKNNKQKVTDEECSNVLENQIISLPSITDYSLASLDENCTDVDSKSCINYNYFGHTLLSSWTVTGVSDNTFEVYYYSNNLLSIKKASVSSRIMQVIYIDGNEIVKSGDGSRALPFEIQ